MKNEEEKTPIPLYLQPFFKKVDERRGHISTVHYTKHLEVKKTIVKKFGEIGEIIKESVFQVRPGIDYENIQTVKEKHDSGEVKRRGLPDSMEKIDRGVYHSKTSGKWLVGCQPVKNKNSIHKSHFLLDGKVVSLDDVVIEDKTLRDVLYSKDINEHEDSDWVNLNVENITTLSGV